MRILAIASCSVWVPEAVFEFDGDLASDVLTAEGLVGGEPGGGVAVGFLLVGGTVDGEEIERVGGKVETLVGRELLYLLPGVGEGDDVVDLETFADLRLLGESEGFTGVWLGEGAADDGAVVFGKGGSIA